LPTRPSYGFGRGQRPPSTKFDLRFSPAAADNKVRPAALSGGAAGNVPLGKEGNELFATLVEEALAPNGDGADPEPIRTTMLDVLDGVAERLLEQIG
jgi:hypothetical protein